MKRYLIGIILFVVGVSAFAQKTTKINLESLANVETDGDLGEWPALIDVAQDGNWLYQLAKDDRYIHVAIVVRNPLLQQMAARHGIVFSVISNGKNKRPTQFIFPFPDAEVKRAIQHEEHMQRDDDKKKLIERSRGYYVQGFLEIPDGLLSFENTYGLAAKATLLADALVYEARIPIASLDLQVTPTKLKIEINDGFSLLPAAKRQSAATRYSYGTIRPAEAKPKAKQTRAVLLETTIQ
ncbi:hypothetical protein [Sphingobacterium griseoflavum]|uniref:DUF5117 domain-containing protein n=1 Tax=Sphingobacterium griseoflavum TaxID=1474952 RepID=A0ABQ3I3D0_9SPHI|nr:hypothetical protein [Sphingobacterium griseoflavum]GHE46381.1 hypothetical protein GCM10017764_32000 [Sphingobacterium griseoflavum]